MTLIRCQRGGLVTCVECGAEMAASRICERCAAPVVARRADAPAAVGHDADQWSDPRIAAIVLGVADLCALAAAFSFVEIYATQGSPAQAGTHYMPLWLRLIAVIAFGSVPVLTTVYLVRRFRRRATERGAAA